MSSTVILISVFILSVAAVAVTLIVVKAKSSVATPGAPAFDSEYFLAPIREQIGQLSNRFEETTKALTETRTSISIELGNVLNVSKEVRSKSEDLVARTELISTALQGTGVRGDWGQVSLKRVAEMAGLTEHVTFNEQKQYGDGKFQPDMVVHLPGGRNVVVDAKAPKIDFSGAENFSTAKLLKKHIKDLSEKNYGKEVAGAIEFTVLFVPSEGVLATALTEDPDLSEHAINKDILLATPMTLLALLKAVEYSWKQFDRMENIEQILADSKELCTRFAILGEHFTAIGSSLSNTVNSYNDAVSSFNTRLKPQIRVIGRLGVDTKRGENNFLVIPEPQDFIES